MRKDFIIVGICITIPLFMSVCLWIWWYQIGKLINKSKLALWLEEKCGHKIVSPLKSLIACVFVWLLGFIMIASGIFIKKLGIGMLLKIILMLAQILTYIVCIRLFFRWIREYWLH